MIVNNLLGGRTLTEKLRFFATEALEDKETKLTKENSVLKNRISFLEDCLNALETKIGSINDNRT